MVWFYSLCVEETLIEWTLHSYMCVLSNTIPNGYGPLLYLRNTFYRPLCLNCPTRFPPPFITVAVVTSQRDQRQPAGDPSSEHL